MIITEDVKILKTECIISNDDKYNEEVATKLLNTLNETKSGIGLSCNQISVTDARVCVINVKEPIVLINPKIVETSEETFVFPEGCLSFPNKHIRTTRFVEVTVEADNHEGQLSFSVESEDIDDAFECACVQHEIDHLDGITMLERSIVTQPYKAPEKIGRNEKVSITDGTKTKELKYKKAEPLLEDGWTLVEA